MQYAIAVFAMSIYGQPYGEPSQMADYTSESITKCISYATDYNKTHEPPDSITCVPLMTFKDAQGRTHWQSY